MLHLLSDWEKNCVGFELRGTAKRFTGGGWLEAVRQILENRDEACRGAILVTANQIKRCLKNFEYTDAACSPRNSFNTFASNSIIL